MARLTVATRLERGRKAIKNTLADPNIGKAVAVYGYDAAEMKIGEGLFDAADGAATATQQREGEQKAATKESVRADKQARKWYGDYVTDARAIFPAGSAERALLVLDRGDAPQGGAEFVQAAKAVYQAAKNAPAPVAAKLAKRSWTPAKLAQAEAALNEMVAADLAQQRAIAAAQQATATQNAALDALDLWVAEYRKFARKALKDDPQALEALGIKA